MSAAFSSKNSGHGFPTPGPQSPTAQQVMDHVFFLTEAAWKTARESGGYDLIIVGTGFCSFAVAKRALERDPHCKILMIERGTFFLPEHFQNLPTPLVQTLGGLSETFPWTLSAKTATGMSGGTIRWQHGMVPFFGGRSTVWSAWCPRPSPDEMKGWPEEIIKAAELNFAAAEDLLHVQKADEVDLSYSPEALAKVQVTRPVYGALQQRIQSLLKSAPSANKNIYRTEAAPLASDMRSVNGEDFEKFATPAEILELETHQQRQAANSKGSPLHIVSHCVVEQIFEKEGVATELQTSRGVLSIGSAKLVLAMGTLPPTTLVQNSFPENTAGERFSAHFITSIVARVPRSDLDPNSEFGELEMGACYIRGKAQNFDRQFHIQLSCLSDRDPEKNAKKALRYMPDVVATASMEQLQTSKGYVVFVCAVLGELDHQNENSWFRSNPSDLDKTTNSLLQITETVNDTITWDTMDLATFDVIENVLSVNGRDSVEYWHGAPSSGVWKNERPLEDGRRIDALVHESSTLHIGKETTAPVSLDYKLRGSENVFITGGALWPQGGSWNPTLTMVALSLDLADKLVTHKDLV